MSAEQKPLFLDMRKGIAVHVNAFKAEHAEGALISPWNPWLHEPGVGKAIWDLTLAMTAKHGLQGLAKVGLTTSADLFDDHEYSELFGWR